LPRPQFLSSDIKTTHLVGIAILSCSVSGCGSKPPTTPTPTASPKITCPSPLTVQSRDGKATTVVYGSATATGGTPPITITCNPSSGSVFPVGQTTVSCVATDAERRTDQCAFGVTVVAPAQIAVTKFVAFGDSITNGEVGEVQATGFIRVRVVERDKAYPAVLQTLLAQRYTAQVITVINDAKSGESVVCGPTIPTCGVSRLPGDLANLGGDVLLLLEGVNDLNVGLQSAFAPTINGLRTMVRTAIGRGMRVMVGTLLPERAGGSRAAAANLIVPFNSELRTMAVSEGATVVDLYQAVIGSLDTSIGADGLHPTVSGYQVMGQAFFDAIKARFELAAVPADGVVVPMSIRGLDRPGSLRGR
jgi:lysophospholipase L1-like esterase